MKLEKQISVKVCSKILEPVYNQIHTKIQSYIWKKMYNQIYLELFRTITDEVLK